jgi:uncharacterized damage-inducible protein DinB
VARARSPHLGGRRTAGAYGCPVSDQRRSTDSEIDAERQEFVDALAKHRGLLVRTLRGISEEQARLRPTVSALCLGGVVKHVTSVEASWSRFITKGAAAMGAAADPAAAARFSATFEMTDDETVAALLELYRERALMTDELVMSLPSLGISHPLPDAPWFEKGAWSARRVLMHVIAETAQHAGHADIIRETIDGAKTMG